MGEEFISERHGIDFEYIRKRITRQFKTNVLNSFIHYRNLNHKVSVGKDSDNKEPKIDKDLSAGAEALIRVGKSSFWGWDYGSIIIFWRDPKDIRHECRDGCELFVKGKLTRFTKKQIIPVDKLEFDTVKNNIERVQNRRYITSGTIVSLPTFFNVPKGDSDTRLVYVLTTCGLNEALWATKLWMIYIKNVLDTATHSSWFSNVDTAEMFYNYKLPENAQPYAGVDVSWDKRGKAMGW